MSNKTPDTVYTAEFDGLGVRFCITESGMPEVLTAEVVNQDLFLSSNISDFEENKFHQEPVEWVTINYVDKDGGEWLLSFAEEIKCK